MSSSYYVHVEMDDWDEGDHRLLSVKDCLWLLDRTFQWVLTERNRVCFVHMYI